MEMTRTEHVRMAKDRALVYVNHGNLKCAVSSMADDLSKHPETQNLGALMVMGMMEIQNGPEAVRRWIEGFAE